MNPNVESLIPQFLADYVHTRRAEFSLPSATALPFISGPSTAEATYPRVIFITSNVEIPHPKRFRLTILVELQNHEKNGTPEENAWTAALRQIVADSAAFKTYLLTLTELQRTGWSMSWYRVADASLSLDLADGIRVRATEVKLEVRAAELAA